MAAAIENRTANATWSTTSRIADVEILGDLAQSETIWRTLEGAPQVSTPYQRFDLLSAWQRQVGERDGASPFIVVARDVEHRPLLMMPLALRTEHGVRVAGFMGGKHTTFNMPLYDRCFAANATSADMEMLVSALRKHAEADVLALHQQPRSWLDVPNPIALLPSQRSVNDCPLLVMTPDGPPEERLSLSFRRRLKTKERKLQALPGYRYYRAAAEADITRLLDWFFRIKPLRMAEQKLPDVFAEPGVEDFIRQACLAQTDNGERAITIHALECDDEIIAIFAGVADGSRFSMMFNTYTMSENARYSCGLILMRYIVDYYAAAGYRSLDLGIGSDDYKRTFCKSDEPIFDSFIPLSLRGKAGAAALSGLNRAKHIVKHNPALLQMAQRLRSAFR